MFKTTLSRVRKRLSFANVTSMLALFVALGGTSYAAATLAHDSVGKGQIRANAVGKSEAAANSVGRSEVISSAISSSEIATNGVGASEIRPNAIDTDEIADGGLQAADLSDAAKAAINGVKFHTAVTATGTQSSGNAKTVSRTSAGLYTVDLGTDVSACQVAATITGADRGFITVTPDATNKNVVTVTTTDPAETAMDRAFNLIVVC
jgi:hypothetical protein